MSTETPAELDSIYGPIREEIRRLDRFLEDEFGSREPFLHSILRHVAQFRGKQIRPALLFLVNRVGRGEVSGSLVKIGAVLEMIHTATLVHDDLLDDARLRRRVETIHRRWGERAAVLMGDFIYSRAFQLSTEVQGMASVLSRTTHRVCEGELLQIGHRGESELTEEVYLEIIRKKTAVLHAVACQLGARFGGLPAESCTHFGGFGLDLGMAFQIIDDCLDYEGQESVMGKSLGTDLRQGKVTLPLILLRERLGAGERRWLRRVLAGRVEPEDEEHVQVLVREHRVVPEALARADAYVQRARATLDLCAGGADTAARESLEAAADYVVKRRR